MEKRKKHILDDRIRMSLLVALMRKNKETLGCKPINTRIKARDFLLENLIERD